MLVRLSTASLQAVVEPDSLWDVLDVLLKNEKIAGYYVHTETDVIEIEIPAGVEIEEMMKEFEQIPNTGKRRIKQ